MPQEDLDRRQEKSNMLTQYFSFILFLICLFLTLLPNAILIFSHMSNRKFLLKRLAPFTTEQEDPLKTLPEIKKL